MTASMTKPVLAKNLRWVLLHVDGVYIGRFSFCSIRGAVEIYDAFQVHEYMPLSGAGYRVGVQSFAIGNSCGA